jgi:hypothetical protein
VTDPGELGLEARIAALVEFLPMLERRVAGVWNGGQKNADGVIQMPWFEYSDDIDDFHRAVGQNGWIDTTFDWQSAGEWVRSFMDQPERLATATAEDIRRLLTAHFRADRFVEGHVASIVESGHMAAIVRRLRSLPTSSP